MPRDKESHNNSITTLYSATLLVARPKQAPPEATTYIEGEFITHAARTRLQVWRLVPSAKTMNRSTEICDNHKMV